jgi:hypothetical protein
VAPGDGLPLGQSLAPRVCAGGRLGALDVSHHGQDLHVDGGLESVMGLAYVSVDASWEYGWSEVTSLWVCSPII